MDQAQPAISVRPASSQSLVTSVDKAFDLCEALSREPGGMSLSELARVVKLPRPSVHRLLAVLKRRGYVRQDGGTQRYSLGMRLLELSFRSLGRSDLRLHAVAVLREYAAASGARVFLAVPASGEVTYVWQPEGGGAAMRTVYGREMPAHCSRYFGAAEARAGRRLSCLELTGPRDVARGSLAASRFGAEGGRDGDGPERLCCACAPVFDYTGHEVARVGVFVHARDDRALDGTHNRGAWELARHLSLRLGYLPAAAMGLA